VIDRTTTGWGAAIPAVYNRDYPPVRACVLVAAVCFVLIDFVVDILHTLLDPRSTLAARR
jgi:ABC-type dipeptide/oligopeptide/nickel transport system permease component